MAERRLALVVATDRYDDTTLRGLAAPAADAEALADALGAPDLGGFEVDVLSNATSWVIAEHVDALLGERQPSDVVLLHFSCHGLKDESGELYLAATNTRPDRLPTTAVDAALVNRLMRRSRAQRIVLLLDCCYGGAFERGVVARSGGDVHVGEQFAPSSLGGGRGRVVITASAAMEYAFEGGELTAGGGPAPSLFTSALVNGIRTGAADRDHDGKVSLDELYDHVHDEVQAHTPHQTPSRWEFGVQGELVIARNPHRVVPVALPPHLVVQAQHTSGDERLNAVETLGSLARATDLGMAASAALLLRALADDDSRRVSEAAQLHLDAVAPRPETNLVDLGRLMCGHAGRAEVSVRGSPLALASSVRPSGPEVTARLKAGLLSLEMVSTQPGPMDAFLTLTGPAGESRIDVVGDVVARDVDEAFKAGVGAPPSRTRASRQQSTHRGLVVGLALAASVATVAAFAQGRKYEDFVAYGKMVGAEYLLLVPAVAGILALACLWRRRLAPIGTGMLAGAAAWSTIFWAKTTIANLADPDVVPVEAFQGTVQTSHWARLVVGVTLGIAVAVIVRSSPNLRAPVTRRRGRRSAIAASIVLTGALLPVLALWTSGAAMFRSSSYWALLLAICLPVAVLRFNPEQRRAALAAATTLCLLTALRDLWITISPGDARGGLATLAGVSLLLTGCLLGQMQALPLRQEETAHPPEAPAHDQGTDI